MIVTIDGPAGSGKSTAARRLARRLGFRFLDTGAMYRAVGLACLQRGVDLNDPEAVAAVAQQVDISLDDARVLLDGVDVGQSIRTAEATEASSVVARYAGVRQAMVALQRQAAEKLNIVCEGRDQGTVVFPDARCKFFLTADPRERALRRQRELAEQGMHVSLDELTEQIRERDARDETREVSPLRAAEDAIPIDTSRLSPDEVLDLLERHVRERMEE